jgi:hypothetical protein
VCYDFLLGIAHRIAGKRPMKYKFVPFPARQPTENGLR